jgi:hypothetical protein
MVINKDYKQKEEKLGDIHGFLILIVLFFIILLFFLIYSLFKVAIHMLNNFIFQDIVH